MSRKGTKRNGDTNAIVDALLPLANAKLGSIDRGTFRARITSVAKDAGHNGVGELTDRLFAPVSKKEKKIQIPTVPTDEVVLNGITYVKKS